MLTLTLLALLCGAVLAFRYKATILFPVIAGAAAIVLFVGITIKMDRWSMVLALAAVMIAIQFGYLFGMFARSMIAGTRAASMRRAPRPEPAPASIG